MRWRRYTSHGEKMKVYCIKGLPVLELHVYESTGDTCISLFDFKCWWDKCVSTLYSMDKDFLKNIVEDLIYSCNITSMCYISCIHDTFFDLMEKWNFSSFKLCNLLMFNISTAFVIVYYSCFRFFSWLNYQKIVSFSICNDSVAISMIYMKW